MLLQALQQSLERNSILLIDVRNVTELNRVGQIPGSECLPLHQINLGFALTDEQFAFRYGFLKPDSTKRHLFIRTSYLAYLLIHRELKLVGRCKNPWKWMSPAAQINLEFALTDEQFAFRYGFLKPDSAKWHLIRYIYFISCSGLELARVPRVPGTRQNSEHHLWHPRILRFLILTGTRRANSM